MFQITEAAQAQIRTFIKEDEQKPIRVFLNPGSCCGPQLAMAFDEQKSTDSIFEVNGLQYVIDKDLLNQIRPVKVDFDPAGFTISSGMKAGGGCSGCGTTDNCC